MSIFCSHLVVAVDKKTTTVIAGLNFVTFFPFHHQIINQLSIVIVCLSYVNYLLMITVQPQH